MKLQLPLAAFYWPYSFLILQSIEKPIILISEFHGFSIRNLCRFGLLFIFESLKMLGLSIARIKLSSAGIEFWMNRFLID